MRKIAGPGHVGNAFVDYDPILNPDGTVHTADWGNDVQNELRGIEDEFSIAESAGTNEYVLAAIKGLIIRHSKRIGELFFTDDYDAPAAFDKDNPDDFFPALCLNTITDYTDISSTNWADLVTHLRAKPAYYKQGKSGAKYAFDVTNWDVTTNVGTLTFANTTAENAILAAMIEDKLVHGSYTNWRTVTLASLIGNIPAGDYALTAIDTTLRTVTFAVTAANGSGAVTSTASFYPHRVAGSSTTARVMEASARALVSESEDGVHVSGLRVRDQMQGHWHQLNAASHTSSVSGGGLDASHTSASPWNTPINGSDGKSGVRAAITDTVNGTPIVGPETRNKALGGFLYIWGSDYAV